MFDSFFLSGVFSKPHFLRVNISPVVDLILLMRYLPPTPPTPIVPPNAYLRFRTISLCLRVRLRLLTAGLVLLRAAGETAEGAAATQAAAKEGRTGTMGTGDLSTSLSISNTTNGGGKRRFSRNHRNPHSSSTNTNSSRSSENSRAQFEQHVKMSIRARLKLLRAACGTLQELDALEAALRNNHKNSDTHNQRNPPRGGLGDGRSGHDPHGSSSSSSSSTAPANSTHHDIRGVPGLATGAGGAKSKRRLGGISMHDGVVEAEGDRTLRANLAGVCVAIMEEMTLPRGWAMGGVGDGGNGEQGGGERGKPCGVDVMAMEVDRIVREEKVR